MGSHFYATLLTASVALSIILLAGCLGSSEADRQAANFGHKNAYATVLYMGTPHDFEFFVAARVMLRSLANLKVEADLVAIVSKDFPKDWINTLASDGVHVISVHNIQNPYQHRPKFDKRFVFTLNKIYAWSLVDYERIVMLDADNLFLQKTDELFQCGQFCAVFIDPCYFHTGLFVLEPSLEVYADLLHEIKTGRENRDGADQGFLTSYFHDLLGRPLFQPPTNGSKLMGLYRLPHGYQMDAVFYFLRLKWNVPCGPNSVITFPSLPMMKPWYWWSWPAMPLGLQWHEQRMKTIGYGSQVLVLALEALLYVVILATMLIVQRGFLASERGPSLKYSSRHCEQLSSIKFIARKTMPILVVAGSFALPFYLVPTTAHPLLGWSIFLLGSMILLTVASHFFQFPSLLAWLTPWLCVVGSLLAMACPFYSNGVIRILSIALYLCFVSPTLWWAFTEITASKGPVPGRESVTVWANTGQPEASSELLKLC